MTHLSVVSRRIRLALLGSAALPLALEAQMPAAPDAARLRAARAVVEATGADSLMLQTMERTLPIQRAQNPRVPAEFWDRFIARARADIPALVDSLVPIYADRFSQAELEQLLVFYRSPLGRRVVAEQGEIAAQSQRVGMRWGAAVGAAIVTDMAQEGKPVRM